MSHNAFKLPDNHLSEFLRAGQIKLLLYAVTPHSLGALWGEQHYHWPKLTTGKHL